jgi:hypothetical protein
MGSHLAIGLAFTIGLLTLWFAGAIIVMVCRDLLSWRRRRSKGPARGDLRTWDRY